MVKDKHVIEALGKAKITIENGEITSITDPLIDYCPIFGKYHKIQKITKEEIRKNIEYRIKDFGMCTDNRVLKMGDMLSVGISEILRSNVELKNIDCVVGACEGCGTLLMTDADLVQGVGGRVSGLVSTTPIPRIIEQIGEENIVNPKTAELNQLKGVELAIERGYKNIAVTILPSKLVEEIRNMPLPEDVNVYIFVAHTTNATQEEVEMLFENADIVTACASKNIINYAQIKKPYYYGDSVPIYAITEKGRYLLDARLKHINKSLSTRDYPQDLTKMAQKLI
jgi:putative methanogenesis marker protein 8